MDIIGFAYLCVENGVKLGRITKPINAKHYIEEMKCFLESPKATEEIGRIVQRCDERIVIDANLLSLFSRTYECHDIDFCSEQQQFVSGCLNDFFDYNADSLFGQGIIRQSLVSLYDFIGYSDKTKDEYRENAELAVAALASYLKHNKPNWPVSPRHLLEELMAIHKETENDEETIDRFSKTFNEY